MLDMQRCKHSGTDTNASPQPNLGTHKRVSAKHADKRDKYTWQAGVQAGARSAKGEITTSPILLPSPLCGIQLAARTRDYSCTPVSLLGRWIARWIVMLIL